MTEEDAKRVSAIGAKTTAHIAVKVGKKGLKLGEKFVAYLIGKAYHEYKDRTRVYKGPKALKKFIKFDKNHSGPIGKLDVNQTDFKEFSRTCKKNGVDFAIVKDSVDPNTMHFFFSGKNAEVMSHLFEDYVKDKYQQDIKNEMLGNQSEKETERATEREAEKDVKAGEKKPSKAKDARTNEVLGIKERLKLYEEHANAVNKELNSHIDIDAKELELTERTK